MVGMGKRVGWGIIGCGWVARDYVAPAIAASSNGRLLALTDPDAAAMAAIGGDARRTTALAEFLATPGLQAVYVATPNHLHRPLVEAAAQAGLAVMCEKPMATTLPDARAMVQACAGAGVAYATAFDQRFHPSHRMLARLLRERAIGTVSAIRIVYACWLDAGWSPDNWRIDPARAGGGALFDLAPHGLDLASMLLDEPLVSVAALGQALVHDYPRPCGDTQTIEDGAVLIARSRSGVLLQMHVAYNTPETLPRRRLEIVGTTGQLIATDTMGQTPGGVLQRIDAADGSVHALAAADDASPFVGQVEAFADHVLGIAPFPFDGAHDLHVMALLEQARSMALPPVTAKV